MKRRSGPRAKFSRCTACGQVFDTPDAVVLVRLFEGGYRRAYQLCTDCRQMLLHPFFDWVYYVHEEEARA